ncbi:MAG: DUF3501 family protein [Caulobacteraceae bacterium]
MLFQIQEMLLIEKGGDEQAGRRAGRLQPDDPPRRRADLHPDVRDRRSGSPRPRPWANWAGVEDHFFLEIDGQRADAVQEGDIERTREDGKTSSVHFLHFSLTPPQIAAIKTPNARLLIGSDHPKYQHLAVISDESRAELAKDLA